MILIPRNGREIVGGLPWLGRMIDKARMINGGNIGDYEFPCGMDMELLNHLKISPEDFIDLVKDETKSEISSREEIDSAILEKLSLRTFSGDERKDSFFSSVFLVRNSRLLNQLESEESG